MTCTLQVELHEEIIEEEEIVEEAEEEEPSLQSSPSHKPKSVMDRLGPRSKASPTRDSSEGNLYSYFVIFKYLNFSNYRQDWNTWHPLPASWV